MIGAIREVQAPLLALILLGACAVKMSRVVRARSLLVVLDATALFPVRLRRPATMVLCATELSLGAGLLITAGRSDAGWPADLVRAGVSVFFLVGMCALVELRARRPGLGCGCFGELSSSPPGVRSIVRAGLLAGGALAGIGAPDLDLRPPAPQAGLYLLAAVCQVALLAAVSPEVGEALVRLGYSAPCELRPASAQRALAALHASALWRSCGAGVTGGEPLDMWRELCWWYVVYPASHEGRECEAVFAVEVRSHRPAVRAALVAAAPANPPAAAAAGRGRIPSATF
jgi:methylamine utilization protein MauE